MDKLRALLPGFYPFWFWNGNQTKGEIDNQLKYMADTNCTGVAIHARSGNQIPYMSGQWLELFRHACITARELGIKIWIYDEDGFPSGNAGGKIPRLRPDLRQHYFRFDHSVTDPSNTAFAAYSRGDFRLLDERLVPAGTPALRFFLESSVEHVDMLSLDASQLFLEWTHEKYKSAIGDLFGNPVEAVYTDDVSFMLFYKYGYVWSDSLAKALWQKTGREIFEILPLLAENGPESPEIRDTWLKTAQTIFLNNFIRPQVKWCNDNGLNYLGHLCGDEGPLSLAIKNFRSPMPFFREENVPSIDDYLTDMQDLRYLSRTWNDRTCRISEGDKPYAPLPLFKTASSASNQYKNGLVSSELFTFLEWSISPDYLAAQMLFELGMGVNLMTPHAYYYTLGGCAKKDCPPSYFFQAPYFPVFAKRIVAWNRIARLLAEKTYHAVVLVLRPDLLSGMTPAESFSTPGMYIPDNSPNINYAELDKKYCSIFVELSRRHIGYETTEETLLLEDGSLSNGQICVGRRRYSVLIEPTGLPCSPSCQILLNQARDSGCMILIDPTADELSRIPCDLKLAGEATEEILVSRYDSKSEGDALYYLMNLSGRNLSPHWETEKEMICIEPLSESAFFLGNSTPNGFVLPKNCACMLLPFDSYSTYSLIPFYNTIFNSLCDAKRINLEPICIEPLSENLMVLKGYPTYYFTVPIGCCIRMVYADLDHVVLNDKTIELSSSKAHKCDSCFRGADISSLVLPGENLISHSGDPDNVYLYLSGTFLVQDGELVAIEPMLQKGDLSRQGYPYYFGSFQYTFRFSGIYDFIEFELTGAASVEMNGKPCGIIFGAPYRVFIRAFCVITENLLVVTVYNTAANMVEGKIVPYGLHEVALLSKEQ